MNGLLWWVARKYRLNSEDAADVVQLTWLRAVEHIGRIADPASLQGWLVTTASRECLGLLRRQSRVVFVDLADSDVPDVSDAGGPEESVVRDEDIAELEAAVALLPVGSRRLLRLLFSECPPSYQAISAETGMKIGSIGPTRQRSLAQLRIALGGEGNGATA